MDFVEHYSKNEKNFKVYGVVFNARACIYALVLLLMGRAVATIGKPHYYSIL
jgi:hypothetical protein